MKIFVASIGRCGTYFMSEIFRHLTAIPSHHEPPPHCAGKFLKDINNSRLQMFYLIETVNELNKKIKQVKKDSQGGWYFESSQMFIKSYAETMLENFPGEIACIYLHRNPIEVVMSYMKKNPAKDGNWRLKSFWENNIMKTQKELSYHENILWEYGEARERFLHLENRFIKVFDFDFRDLNNIETWKCLFRHFQIPHKPFTKLPLVGKNEIKADPGETLKKVFNTWEDSIVNNDSDEEFFTREHKSIEEAKRQIAINSARMNSHAIR